MPILFVPAWSLPLNWMQFTLSLLDIVIWPSVVVGLCLLLRNPLIRLLPLAKKLKYKDFEMEFGEELKAANREARQAFPELVSDKKAQLIASVENLPNSAILNAWNEVEDEAGALLKSQNPALELNTETPYKHMGELLVMGGHLDIAKGKLFTELRRLRNKVAHAKDFQVGRAEAIQYVELCFQLKGHLGRGI